MTEKEDYRAYLYRYIKAQDTWGFIALNKTDMRNKPVLRVPIEKWSTTSTDGESVFYELCNIFYSKQKVCSMIKGQQGLMSGTDLFQVTKSDEVVCVIWAPAGLPDTLDITCYSTNCNQLVDGKISFIELKKLIQASLSIKTIDSVLIYSESTHIV